MASLRRLCARLLGLGPGRRIVLTVNSVPIRRAMSPSDATRETMRKAALWMTAVEQIANEFPNVAYYPLFEALTVSGGREWLDEFNHVREEFMDRLVAAMLHAFGIYVDVSIEQLAAERDAGEAAPVETAADIDLAALGARVAATIPDRAPTVRRFAVDVDITNVGSSILQSAGRYPVSVCYRWYDAAGALQEIGKSIHTSLPAPLQPGENVTLTAVIATPAIAGRYTLALTLVKHEIAWLDDLDVANGQRSDVLVEAWDAGRPD